MDDLRVIATLRTLDRFHAIVSDVSNLFWWFRCSRDTPQEGKWHEM